MTCRRQVARPSVLQGRAEASDAIRFKPGGPSLARRRSTEGRATRPVGEVASTFGKPSEYRGTCHPPALFRRRHGGQSLVAVCLQRYDLQPKFAFFSHDTAQTGIWRHLSRRSFRANRFPPKLVRADGIRRGHIHVAEVYFRHAETAFQAVHGHPIVGFQIVETSPASRRSSTARARASFFVHVAPAVSGEMKGGLSSQV